jgi:hypothetical protein
MKRLVTLLGIVYAVVLVNPNPADACSCVRPSLGRSELPRDGASGFPTDGHIRIFLTGGWSPELRAGLSGEYRLRGPDGKLVPFTHRVDQTMLTLSPKKRLKPSSEYVIERIFAYRNGERLSDDARWSLALFGPKRRDWKPNKKLPPPDWIRRWYPHISFRTGAGPERRTVQAPEVTKARVGFRYGGGDCGPGTSLTIYYRPRSLLATDVLAVERKGDGLIWWFEHSEELRTQTEDGLGDSYNEYLSNLLCTPDKIDLGVAAPFQVRFVSISAAGKSSKVTGWKKSDKPARRGYIRIDDDSEWKKREKKLVAEGTKRFLSGRIDSTPVAAPSGPQGCAHGLESKRIWDLSDGGFPWTYEDRACVGWAGDQGWTLNGKRKKQAPSLFFFESTSKTATKTVPIPKAGYELRAFPVGKDRFLIISTVYFEKSKAKKSAIRVSLIGLDGKPLWEHTFERKVTQWHPFAAIAPDRVLVGWLSWGKGDDSLKQRITWAIIETGSGKVTREPKPSGLLGSSDALTTAIWDGDEFLMAWAVDRMSAGKAGTLAPGPHITRISKSGKLLDTTPLPDRRATGFDFAPASFGTLLVWGDGSAIKLARLDEKGRVKGDPFVVSSGTARRPRKPVVTWRPGLIAVAWEAHSSQQAYVSVIDDAGSVSEPFLLAKGALASTVALAPAGEGFIVAYGRGGASFAGGRATTELVVCSSRSSGRAPARLEK